MCDKKLLCSGLQTLTIRVEKQGIDNILSYCRELQKWNKRINLIARNTPADEVIEKHFLDSLTLLPMLIRFGADEPSLLDVGTGAGFPGLVLAAVMPELAVTLVEPREKRVVFLRHIVRTLQLKNVRIIASRLEQAGLEPGEFTWITSRAVADITRFLAMVDELATQETQIIVMRADKGEGQDYSAKEISIWQQVDEVWLRLPYSGASRLLTVLQKMADFSNK